MLSEIWFDNEKDFFQEWPGYTYVTFLDFSTDVFVNSVPVETYKTYTITDPFVIRVGSLKPVKMLVELQ